jgi:hypothetical protein
MPIQLWHFTWPEHADLILADGFRDGRLGFVFFSPPRDTYWELSGKLLLEVTLDVDEVMVAINRSESHYANNYRQIVYRIPAAYANAHLTAIRVVPVDEYRRRPMV